MTGNEVADRGVGLLPALLRGPFANWITLLPKRERDARDIRRDPRNSRAAGGNADEQRHFRLGGQRRDRRGDRRQDYAGQQLHMLARDQFLSQPLADFRIGSIVTADQLDLDPLRQILLMLLEVEIDALLRLVR